MPTVQDYYNLPAQYSLEDWTTSTPEGDQQAVSYAPGYALDLLALRQKVLSGQASDWEREDYAKQANAAMAVPLRDMSTLTYDAGEQGPGTLSGGSPDLGRLMLTLQDKIDQGTASPQEQALFQTTYANLADQNWRASVPQASDAFNPLGDQFFGALGVLGLGATGGLAAAPLFAGGAGLATTLGSLGTLSGIAGTGAGLLGQEMDQDWLRKLGMGLGAAGGIAGGASGLANLWGSGITSLSDAAKLASSVGRLTGGLGTLTDSDILKQAGGVLSAAGQAGGGASTIADVFGEGVNDLTDAARLASGVGQVTGAVGRVTGNRPLQQASGILNMGTRLAAPVQRLLGASQQAQQRGTSPPGSPVPRTMTDADWLRWTGQPGPWRSQPEAQSVLWNL